MKEKKLISNIFSNWGIVFFNLCFPLITLPILTRDLGLEGYGRYAQIFSMAMIYVTLTEFGMDMALTRLIANSKSNFSYCKSLVLFFLKLRIVVAVLVLPVTLFFLYDWLGLSFDSLLAVFVICLFSSLTFNFYYQGLLRSPVLLKMLFFNKLMIVFLYIASLWMDVGLNGFLYIAAFNAFLISFLPGFSIFWELRKNKASKISSIDVFKSGMAFFGSRLVVNTYLSGSPFFVSLFLGPHAVGLYSLSLQVYRIGSGLIGALAKSLLSYPVYSSSFNRLVRLVLVLTTVAIVLYPFMWIIASRFIPVLFGSEFSQSVSCIMVFVIALIFQISGSIFGYPFFNAIGKIRIAHLSMFFCSLVYVLMFFLGVYFGMDSALYFVLCIVLVDFCMAAVRTGFACNFGGMRHV